MTPTPLKVGFVGLSTQGWAANALAPSLLDPSLKDKYTLTAVSTTSEDSATATARKYTEELGHSVKAFWGDSSKIAKDPDVDFVIVSVKAPLHKATLDPIIAAGKPFFVEWPGGTSFAQSTAMAEAATAKGIRGIVGLQARQSLVIKKAKEFLDSGKIGQIRSTHLVALFPGDLKYWGPQVIERAVYANYRSQGATGPHIGGGHILDPFHVLLGRFATISATGFTVYKTAEVVDSDGKPTGKVIEPDGLDHVAFSGRLESGALASVTWRTGYKSTPGRTQLVWEIDGEEGTIRIDSQAPLGAFFNNREPNLYVNGERVEIPDHGVTANLTREWEEFAKGESGNYPKLEDGVEVHKVLDAIERSAKEGVTIVLRE